MFKTSRLQMAHANSTDTNSFKTETLWHQSVYYERFVQK